MIAGSIKGAKRLHRDFKILTLTPEKKTAINKNTIAAIRKNLLSNKNKQQDPEGHAWTPRKKPKYQEDKKGKLKVKKMLQRIQNTSRTMANPKIGVFNYKTPVGARIAAEHQYGAEIPIRAGKKPTAEEMQGISTEYGGGATMAQAELLLQLGFNEPKNPENRHHKQGKSGISPRKVMELYAQRIINGDSKTRKASSTGYIMRNLSFGQAGMLIKALKKAHDVKGRSSQTMKLPQRQFLDEDPDRNSKRMTAEIDKVLNLK